MSSSAVSERFRRVALAFADLEDATEEELDPLQKKFEGIREKARAEKQRGRHH